MAQWKCKICGHIGYPQWVHNDEKCERCYSGQIVELSESIKSFHTQTNVGKAKYVVNYHDGVKTNKDGSPFFDVAIFCNKKELINFQNGLLQDGHVEK